jgi:hypothetical protein
MKIYTSILLMLVLILAACNSTGQPSGDSQQVDTVTDLPSLIVRLEVEGATVEERGEIEQPFFSATGRIIGVNGEDVQVFEYPDVVAAEQDAEQIAPDGSTSTMMINWIATPHFYRSDRLIALYVGDNAEIVELLNTVLGEQFAGG